MTHLNYFLLIRLHQAYSTVKLARINFLKFFFDSVQLNFTSASFFDFICLGNEKSNESKSNNKGNNSNAKQNLTHQANHQIKSDTDHKEKCK